MEEQTTGLTQETESATAGGINDIEPILPEGWDGKSNPFAATPEDALDFGADNGDASGDNGDTTGALTMGAGQETAADNPQEENETTEPTPGSATEATGTEAENKEPQKPESRFLDLLVNHEQKRVDVNALSDDEMTVLLQKGYAFDALKAAQTDYANAEKFRAYCHEQIPKLMNEDGLSLAAAKGVAAMNAQTEGMKVYPISVSDDGKVTLAGDYANGVVPFPEEVLQTKRPEESASAQKTGQATPPDNFEAEFRRFKALFPSVTEIPNEVAEIRKSGGVSLAEAMMFYQMRQTSAKSAEVAKENKVLRQNAEAASRAPVKSVTAGGAVKQPSESMTDWLIKGLKEG